MEKAELIAGLKACRRMLSAFERTLADPAAMDRMARAEIENPSLALGPTFLEFLGLDGQPIGIEWPEKDAE